MTIVRYQDKCIFPLRAKEECGATIRRLKPGETMDTIGLLQKTTLKTILKSCYYCGDYFAFTVPPESKIGLKRVPCPRCKEFMQQGIILISIADDSDLKKEPMRTGKFAVVTRESMKELLALNPTLFEQVSQAGYLFVHDKTWTALGLPE